MHDGGPTDVPTTSAKLTAAALPALRLLSVTDVVQDPGDPPVASRRCRSSTTGPTCASTDSGRAAARRGGRRAAGRAPATTPQLDAVLDPAFDGRRTVVTATPLPGLRAGPGRGAGGQRPDRGATSPSGWWSTPPRGARRELVLTDLQLPRLEGDR